MDLDRCRNRWMDGWLAGCLYGYLNGWAVIWLLTMGLTWLAVVVGFLGYKSIVNNNDNINEIPFPFPAPLHLHLFKSFYSLFFQHRIVCPSVRLFVCVPQSMWNALSDAEVFSGRMTVDVNDFDCVVVELTWLLWLVWLPLVGGSTSVTECIFQVVCVWQLLHFNAAKGFPN